MPRLPHNRGVLSIADRNRRRLASQGVEETLSSALLASDNELERILLEFDKISRALRTDSPDEQTLRAAIHPAVWGAVKHALLDRELRHLALTDDLTCLYNRRGFFAVATQQLKVARRNQQGLLLFYADLDDLKKINDTFGHTEGDLAIVRTADALEAAFRASDTIARLGGDEFAILALEVADKSRDMLLHRLDSILRKASRTESRYELSVSVGVARFDPRSGVSLGELMAQADRAMYEKKKNRKTSSPQQLSITP